MAKSINTKKIGDLGEKIIENYLAAREYQIIKRNFHSRFGEIDIIAISPSSILTFIEVKTRRTHSFGHPLASITFKKQQKLIKTALYFLNCASAKERRLLPKTWRIDAISVELKSKGRSQTTPQITHLKNILNG